MIFSKIAGATPIEDESQLLQAGIVSFNQLCSAEAENILKSILEPLFPKGKRFLLHRCP